MYPGHVSWIDYHKQGTRDSKQGEASMCIASIYIAQMIRVQGVRVSHFPCILPLRKPTLGGDSEKCGLTASDHRPNKQ